MAREGVPLVVIQRQLGHANLGITFHLPTRHRQRRNHRHRPLTTSTSHLSHRRPDRPVAPRASAGRHRRPARPGVRALRV
jgi:hypothetical protein